jgi:integrase
VRVFKTTYRDRNGRQQTAAKHYVEFRDHREQVRRLPGFTDDGQTAELGRKVEKLVACVANGEAPDLGLRRWLESTPDRIRAKLTEWGLLEGHRAAAGKPLAKHLDDFKAALIAKGNTKKHARTVSGRVRAIVEGCGFQTFATISASRVEAFMAKRRDEDKLSAQTVAFHLSHIKQFCRWMVRDGRAMESPVAHLALPNVAVDRRHDRRALSPDELRRLLAAATAGPTRYGATGPERALVYRLAVESGLRASELRSLTRASFRLDLTPALVVVEAGSSKRRRRDELPLRADTAAALTSHLANKLPGAAAFNLPSSDKTAAMIRADLDAARKAWIKEASTADERAKREETQFLAYRDDAGHVADFHGLRHTFLTNLARSGVHPKVAQQLARHSTITLTMDRYSHTVLGELGEAIDRLPSLSPSTMQQQRATGTDDGMAADCGNHSGESEAAGTANSRLALCLALSDAESCAGTQRDAVNASTRGDNADSANAGENAEFTPKSSGWGGIRTPVGLSPKAVFKTAALDRSATHPDQPL